MAIKKGGKFALLFLALTGVVLGYTQLKKKGFLGGDKSTTTASVPSSSGGFVADAEPVSSDVLTLRVGLNVWGGFAGAPYYNMGFNPTEASRYFKDYGFAVKFVVFDGFEQAKTVLLQNEVDIVWNTVDALPTQINSLKAEGMQVFCQIDWSRGGDCIIARRGINNVNDIAPKGGDKKTIAVVEMSPSHSMLLNVLNTANLKQSDVKLAKVADALKATEMFKNGACDLAVIWAPDDEDLLKSVAGSKVVMSTAVATDIIADVWMAKGSFISAHSKEVRQFVEGQLKGNAEINASNDARVTASKVLAQGFNMPEDFCYSSIGKARLATFGDNKNFFGLNTSYTGVTAKDLYTRMAKEFMKAGDPEIGTVYISSNNGMPDVPPWQSISNTSLLQQITSLTGAEHAAEGAVKYVQKTEVENETAEAISTKRVTIMFAVNSADLTDDAKDEIDRNIKHISKGFKNSRIRIEGNTDNTGNAAQNRVLSKRRAQAVADYLIEQGIDGTRFVIIGKGPDNPVADNSTDAGRRANRRTDFELIANQ